MCTDNAERFRASTMSSRELAAEAGKMNGFIEEIPPPARRGHRRRGRQSPGRRSTRHRNGAIQQFMLTSGEEIRKLLPAAGSHDSFEQNSAISSMPTGTSGFVSLTTL